MDEQCRLFHAGKSLLMYVASAIRYGNFWNPRRRQIELDELRGYLETFEYYCMKTETCNPNPRSLLNQPLNCFISDSWRTLLEEALSTQDPDIVSIVLQVGVDTDHVGITLHTPLDYGIYYSKTKISPEMITEKRSIPELLIDFGATKLMKPCTYDPVELIDRHKYENIITNMQRYSPDGHGYEEVKSEFKQLVSIY